MKKSVEERLERASLAIMKHSKFCAWGGLQFVGKRSIVDDPAQMPTAAVDSLGNTYYGRAFIDGLPMEGNKDVYVNFVVLHETGHKALMHCIAHARLFEENPALANIAADHVVNLLIHELDPQEEFAKMILNPDGTIFGCRDPKYKGWSTKEVYNDLKKNGGSGQGTGQGKPLDQHNIFKDYDKPFQKDDPRIKEVQKQIEHALRAGSILASKYGTSCDRMAGELREEQIRWEDHLSEFILETCQGEDNATWRRVNRRFVSDDVYVPTSTTDTIGEVVCAMDESGSVSQLEHDTCLTEVIALCRQVRPAKLRLIYWSDGITKEEVYTPDEYDGILTMTKPRGGGGTDVEPVAEYVKTLPDVQCAVILTDGGIYGSWGENSWGCPTLWCITRKHVMSPIGKTLYLDLE